MALPVRTALLLALAFGLARGAEETPLRQGVAAYESQAYEKAATSLREARAIDPDDPEAALFLGLTLLRLEKPGEAAVHWSDYVRLAEGAPLEPDVKRYITILLREANRKAAEEAVLAEAQLSTDDADPRTVAVSPFRNLGSAEYAPLGKAFAAILIDNLSALPDVLVLERERMQTLLDEAELAGTGLVDAETAVRAGKLLRAGKIVTGTFIEWVASPARLGLESTLVEVGTGKQAEVYSGDTPLESFHELVPDMSARIAGAIQATGIPLPPDAENQIRKEHTQNVAALLAFGRGLDAKDRGDFPAAREAFEEALREDPEFELADRELRALPFVLISGAAAASAVETALITGIVPSQAGAASTFASKAAVIGGAAAATAAAITAGIVATNGDGGGGAGGGGAGGGGGPEGCIPDGDACTAGGECCSDRCAPTAGSGAQSECCLAVGEACNPGSPACCGSGSRCPNGTCCLANGNACQGDDDCCSRSCIDRECTTDSPDATPPATPPAPPPASTPTPAVTPTPPLPTPTPCIPPGSTGCAIDTDCCSGVCPDGTCCENLGASCGSPTECCTGNCELGQCCAGDGQTCNTDADCCPGFGCDGICFPFGQAQQR